MPLWGYYEEVGEGQIIPPGSRSQPGTLIGVGPGLCGLRAILLKRTSENASSTHPGE